ncbi:MAG: hypothetical protein IKJ52_04110 [Muribaculaceae bacterium]|nr:hypothetical protein [Muribaculaceae bacterium]
MGNIVYIQENDFFARKYNNGIIVFFKKGNRNIDYEKCSNKIYDFVNNNCGKSIFTSDIIENINNEYPDEFVSLLNETLFVYKENELTIESFGIQYLRDSGNIEIKYERRCVLKVNIDKRFSYKWLVFIAVILGIILGVVVSKRIMDSDNNIPDKTNEQKGNTTTNSDVNISDIRQEETTSFIKYDNDTNDEISEQIASEQEKIDDQYSHSSYKEEQNTDDISPENDSDKSRKISEAKEYLSKADAYYNKYFNTFDRNEGENALYNYKKVLEIIKDENIYSFERRESIESAVQVLEQVLEEELN